MVRRVIINLQFLNRPTGQVLQTLPSSPSNAMLAYHGFVLRKRDVIGGGVGRNGVLELFRRAIGRFRIANWLVDRVAAEAPFYFGSPFWHLPA